MIFAHRVDRLVNALPATAAETSCQAATNVISRPTTAITSAVMVGDARYATSGYVLA